MILSPADRLLEVLNPKFKEEKLKPLNETTLGLFFNKEDKMPRFLFAALPVIAKEHYARIIEDTLKKQPELATMAESLRKVPPTPGKESASEFGEGPKFK